MKASSLDEIYRFEHYVERAIQRALKSLGVRAYVQRDPDELKTPYVILQLEMGDARGQLHPDKQGVWRDCSFNAKLFAEIKTRRAANADAHEPLVSRLRRMIPEVKTSITEAMLPYHLIMSIRNGQTAPNIEAEDGVDVTHLSFDLIIFIRPDAWPEVVD